MHVVLIVLALQESLVVQHKELDLVILALLVLDQKLQELIILAKLVQLTVILVQQQDLENATLILVKQVLH